MTAPIDLRDLPAVDACRTCEGTGIAGGPAEDGQAPQEPPRCPNCGGTGRDRALGVEIPDTVGQTFLKYEDRCPRSAWLYLKFRGGPPTHALARGTAFHDFAARATASMIENDEPTIPHDVAKAILDEVLTDRIDLVIPAAERDALRAMVWNWSQATSIDPATIILVEQLMTWEVGGFTIRGRIDLALDEDGVLSIPDYKTSFNVPPQDDFEGDFQTQLYGALIAFGETADGERIGAGFQRFRFANVFPRYLREDDGTLATRSFERTREDLVNLRSDVETQLARLRRAIESGRWPAIPGTHCGECPAGHECPLPIAFRPDSEVPESIEEAQRLAEWRYTTQQQMKRVGRRLKAFAEREGVVIPIGAKRYLGFNVLTGERMKRKVLDESGAKLDGKVALRLGVEGAVEYGHPFDWNDYFEPYTTTKFEEIKRTEGGENE